MRTSLLHYEHHGRLDTSPAALAALLGALGHDAAATNVAARELDALVVYVGDAAPLLERELLSSNDSGNGGGREGGIEEIVRTCRHTQVRGFFVVAFVFAAQLTACRRCCGQLSVLTFTFNRVRAFLWRSSDVLLALCCSPRAV